MKNSSGSAESGRWVERLGFARSYIIAYGIPGWKWRLSKLYAPFIKKGMLCFDIGSHLGNRIPIWRKGRRR